MPIRAVFFDLDDTLLDTNGTRFARAELAAARLVKDHPHLSHEDLCSRFLAPGPIYPQWVIGVGPVLEELGLHSAPEGLDARGLWFFQGCEHLIAPIEGVADAIRALDPEIIVGVITNGPEDIQGNKFKHLGLQERISVFMTSERAGVAKPDPRIFALALGEAGIQAQDAVFVGDILDIDVVGALAAGMHAIWFNPKRQTVEMETPPAHHDLGSYAELAGILEKLQAL